MDRLLLLNWTVWLSVVAVFASVVLLVLGLGTWWNDRQRRTRLAHLVPTDRTSRIVRAPSQRHGPVQQIVETLSLLALPRQGWQDQPMALKFVQAGMREPHIPASYFAVKATLSMLVPLIVVLLLWVWQPALASNELAMWGIAVASAGYYLPDLLLNGLIKRRSRGLQSGLPDMLDLLVVSVEAGLGLDAAIHRVARAIERAHPVLAEEFYLAVLEIRAGVGRTVALRNLALRVPLDDLRSFVTMLVQAEKFGTSLADALRVQADVMRVKRVQRAEEMAAKVPVKMLLPLVFLIFPALMMVLIGPAAIQMSKVLGSGT